jgi:hypothetical protein
MQWQNRTYTTKVVHVSRLSSGKSSEGASRVRSAKPVIRAQGKNSPDTEGGGDTRFSAVLSGEGVLRTSDDESSPRLSKADSQAIRVVVAPTARAWDEAATSNRRNFLDASIGFVRANSISDVPHGPDLTFGRAIFRTPTFLAGPALGRGATILDEGARPEPAFAFLVASFFATSAFRFLLADCEAAEPGWGRGKYGTPICSRTWFKRPSFGIFATLKASYSLGPKLPSTFSASVSTSAKKRSTCSAAMVPTANSGRGVSTFDTGVVPRGTLEAETRSQRINLTRYILFDSIMTPDSSRRPSPNGEHACYCHLRSTADMARNNKTMILSTQPTICS